MNLWGNLLQIVLDQLMPAPTPDAAPAPDPASVPVPYRVLIKVATTPDEQGNTVPERIRGAMAFFDGSDPIAATPVWYDTLEFLLPLEPWARDGALVRLKVSADGCDEYLADATVASRMTVTLERSRPRWPIAGRLTAQGRWLLADGHRLKWRGIMAFRLLELEAHQPGEADRVLDFCAEHRAYPRFLMMMDNPQLFVLTREEGLATLPRLAQKLKDRGLYGAAVACVGTRDVAFDWNDQMVRVGAIAEAYGNIRVAVGNELFPIHNSESGDLTPDRLLQLARLVPSAVPVSLGSTHGADCEDRTLPERARRLPNGIALAHDLRVGDENGWKWVRHPNDLGWIADDVGIWLASEEPQRQDVTPGKHLATAVICHGIRNIGDCFHYGGGVQAKIPVGAELEAFLARKQGWDLAADWHGTYANAGQAGSPVKGFSNALRVYSSFAGGESLVVACDAASAVVEWHAGVRTTLIAERDGAKVWKATRT